MFRVRLVQLNPLPEKTFWYQKILWWKYNFEKTMIFYMTIPRYAAYHMPHIFGTTDQKVLQYY